MTMHLSNPVQPMPEPVMPPKALPKSVAAEPGKDEDIEKRDWEKLAPILLDL